MAEIIQPPEVLEAYLQSPEMIAEREAFLARLQNECEFLRLMAEEPED